MQPFFTVWLPDEINFTLSYTLPLKDWKLLRRDLESSEIQSSVSLEFREAIVDIILQLEEKYTPRIENAKKEKENE